MDEYEIANIANNAAANAASDLRYELEQKVRDINGDYQQLLSLIRGLDERVGILESEVHNG